MTVDDENSAQCLDAYGDVSKAVGVEVASTSKGKLV